jgi:hypothetical protein
VAEPVRRVVPLARGDEFLDVEEFSCLAEARVAIRDWQEDYNWRRAHSSLGMKAPTVRRRLEHERHAPSRGVTSGRRAAA